MKKPPGGGWLIASWETRPAPGGKPETQKGRQLPAAPYSYDVTVKPLRVAAPVLTVVVTADTKSM
jgi:hypothetical protein